MNPNQSEQQGPTSLLGAMSKFAGNIMLYQIGMLGVRHVTGILGQAAMKTAVSAAKAATFTSISNPLLRNAARGLASIPSNTANISIGQFAKGLGFNFKPIAPGSLTSKVLNYAKDTAFSLPVMYAMNYMENRDKGENVGFGRLAVESVASDVVFRGAGAIFKSTTKGVGSIAMNSVNNIYNKHQIGEKLTGLAMFKHSLSENFLVEKAKLTGSPNLQTGVFPKLGSPIVNIESGLRALNRTLSMPVRSIRENYVRHNLDRVGFDPVYRGVYKSVLNFSGTQPRNASELGAFQSVVHRDFESIGSFGTYLGKKALESVQFGGVSVAKSIGLSHLITANSSDVVASKIDSDKTFLVAMKSVHQGTDAKTDVGYAKDVAAFFGYTGDHFDDYIKKNPIVSAFYMTNKDNKEAFQRGLMIVPKGHTVISSASSGLQVFNEQGVAMQGASKAFSTGNSLDANTFMSFDNVKPTSRLGETVMNSALEATTSDGQNMLGELFPAFADPRNSAAELIEQVLEKDQELLSNEGVHTQIIHLFQKFKRESYHGTRISRTRIAKQVREDATVVGIPQLSPDDFVGSDYEQNISKHINDLNGIKSGMMEETPTKVTLSEHTRMLQERIKNETTENVLQIKTMSRYNPTLKTFETTEISLLQEYNDALLVDYLLNDAGASAKEAVRTGMHKNDMINLELMDAIGNGNKEEAITILRSAYNNKSNNTYEYLKSTNLPTRSIFGNDPLDINSFDKETRAMVARFKYSEVMIPKGEIIDGETSHYGPMQMFSDHENIHSISSVVMQSAATVVEPLAKKFGVSIQPSLGKDLHTFYEELLFKSSAIIGGSLLAYTGVNALVQTPLFENTGLENGLLPFAGSIYNDFRMASQMAMDVTGVSAIARTMDDMLPGIIHSPMGGFLRSVLPVYAGLQYGLVSGNLTEGIMGGLAGSAVLGGLGTSVFGHHDIRESAGDLYGTLTGNEQVAIRKARFWGLSSGSFWGENIQYHRNYWSANDTDPMFSSDSYGTPEQFLTDSIGATSAVERNYLSRPLATNDMMLGSVYGSALRSDPVLYGSNVGDYGYSESLGISQSAQLEYARSMNEDFYGMSEVYGMRGFIVKDAVIGNLRGETMSDYAPVMQTADDVYSADKMFWDANLGGLAGQTEYIRRVLPKYKQNREFANPARNTMPEWLPGASYFIDFKTGDPYTKIQEGFMRLPGQGYLKTNDVDINNMPLDLEIMGEVTNQATINAILGIDGESLQNKTAQGLIKQGVLDSYTAALEAYDGYIKENPVYYGGGNIIAQADLQVNSTPVKIEVVNAREYMEARKNKDNKYKRKADLLATIAKKKSELIIVNQETREQFTIHGEYDVSLLRAEIAKINELKPELYKQLKENKFAKVDAFYSIADRYAILADVAPYSNETRTYEKLMMDMAESGELSREAINKVAKAKRQKQAVIDRMAFNMDGNPSPLSGFVVDKMLAPEHLDPLESYIGRVSHGSAVKKWEEPLSYFRSDFATTLSGAANPVRRGLGSGILYGTMFGQTSGLLAASGTAAATATANMMGGINLNSDYIESRDILLQESALQYKRNQAQNNPYIGRNLYGQLRNGGSIDDMLQSIDSTDRSYLKAFANEKDENRQRLIAQSIHPVYGEVLDQAYGTDFADASVSLQKAQQYIESVPNNSEIVLNKGINVRDLSVITMDRRGIDPRLTGRGFKQQRYQMYLNKSSYGLEDANVPQQSMDGLVNMIKSTVNVKDVRIDGNLSDNVIEVIFTD